MRYLRIWLLIPVMVIGLAPDRSEADYIYMSIDDGAIPGSITHGDWSDWFSVGAFSHAVEVPFDLTAGTRLGVRQHTPLYVGVFMAYEGIPMLVDAIDTSRNFASVVLKFFRVPEGTEEQYFEIELENAFISLLETHYDGPNGDNYPFLLSPYHQIAFYYQIITWTFFEEGIAVGTFSDTWTATPAKRLPVQSDQLGAEMKAFDLALGGRELTDEASRMSVFLSAMDVPTANEVNLTLGQLRQHQIGDRTGDALRPGLYRYRIGERRGVAFLR